MSDHATIEKITISNILGIEHLSFSPGRFNVIEGGNGAGKTSVLDAIRSIFDADEATLLRRGQEKGEVVLVLSDGKELRRRVTDKTSNLFVEQDGIRQAKPATVAGGLIDFMSVNPVDFIAAKGKKRVAALLEALPMQADPERIRTLIGDATYDPGEGHALEVIQKAYDIVFQERRDTNRAKSQKESTITQLSGTLPPRDEAGPAGDEAGLQRQLDDVETRRQAEMTRVDTKLAGLRTASQEKVAGLRGQIAELQQQIIALQEDIVTETTAFAGVESKAGQQRVTANTRFDQERDPIKAQLAAITADRESAIRNQQTRESIQTLRKEANELEDDSARMTASLIALEAYKGELLGALPIEGLEVVDGEILRDGIPFDRLNTAQQVQIAVEVAKLRAGELGVICVDGLELMDTEHFEAFRAAALESNLQMFVTRVADQGDLTVQSEG